MIPLAVRGRLAALLYVLAEHLDPDALWRAKARRIKRKRPTR